MHAPTKDTHRQAAVVALDSLVAARRARTFTEERTGQRPGTPLAREREALAQVIADVERRSICEKAPQALRALASDRRKRADEDAALTPMQRAAQHEAAHHIEKVADLLSDLPTVLDAIADPAPPRDWLGEEIDRMARAGIPNLDNAGDGTVDGPDEDDLR